MSVEKDGELDLRREAMLEGLRETLKEAQAQSAMWLWLERYESTRPLAITDFVAEVCEELKMPPRRGAALRLALYRSLIDRRIN